RVEVETYTGEGKVWSAAVNEPWSSIDRGLKPRPRITQWQPDGRQKGTMVKVYGHPPGRERRKAFTVEEVRAYLQHRTFVGFTKPRASAPSIELSVLGHSEVMPFGFPELQNLPSPAPAGTVVLPEMRVQK